MVNQHAQKGLALHTAPTSSLPPPAQQIKKKVKRHRAEGKKGQRGIAADDESWTSSIGDPQLRYRAQKEHNHALSRRREPTFGSLAMPSFPCRQNFPSPITKHFGTDAVSSGCKGTNGPCHGCWVHSKKQPKRSIEASSKPVP